MVIEDRKQAVHEEPAAKPSVPVPLKYAVAVLAVATALITLIPVQLKVVAYAIGAHDSLSSIPGINERIEAADERINAVRHQLSKELSDAGNRITSVEDQILEELSNTGNRITAVEDRLLDVPSDISQTLSRVPALETALSQLSAFDTVYLFKHTFDFPDPLFNVEEEGIANLAPSSEERASALICTELPATHRLFEEIERYKRELSTFDNSIELKFYTMGRNEDEPVQTMIRQETACYKRTLNEDGTPRDSRIRPAPVEIRMQAESARDSDDNSGTFISNPTVFV